jgi:hypothetical protein
LDLPLKGISAAQKLREIGAKDRVYNVSINDATNASVSAIIRSSSLF